MAFASGRTSESSFKRYIGVGSWKVLAANPGVDKLKEIYPNREEINTPEYLGTATVKDSGNNDKEVKIARIRIYVKSDPDKNNGIETVQSTNITIYNSPWYSFKNGVVKAQVIDEYGRSTWATLEDIKAKKIPVLSNGKPANISANYRMAYRGEVELTDFIINFLNIPGVQTYDRETKTWKMVKEPKNSEARLELDTIKNILKGNFAELNDILMLQPENHIKMALGVRSNDEGKLYQELYTRKTLRNGATTTDAILKDIQDAQAAGSMKNTEFLVLNESGNACLPLLQEYNPAPTPMTAAPEAGPEDTEEDPGDLPEPGIDDLPFGDED